MRHPVWHTSMMTANFTVAARQVVATAVLLVPHCVAIAEEPPVAEQPAKRPWLVSEAALPAGFPAPGPVNEVVVKTYPAHRLARVSARGGANGMFMKLFRHIERNEIAMTAPVEMAWPDDAGQPAGSPEAMAFLYGKPSLGAVGVDPKDQDVEVADVTAEKVVSVGLRGSYDKKTFDRGYAQLQEWLRAHPEWKPAGSPRTLAYNSPFVPGFAKFSEVQIPVAPAGP